MSDENTPKPDDQPIPAEPAAPAPPPAGDLIAETAAVENAAASHEPSPEARYEGTLEEAHAAVPEAGPAAEEAPESPPAEEAAETGADSGEYAAPAEAGQAEPADGVGVPEHPADGTPAEAAEGESPPAKKTRKSSKKAPAADATEAEAPAEVAPEPAGVAPAAAGEAPAPQPESKKKWYVVKIQSGREESIKAAIERKVKIEGLEEYFGQIVIPVEEIIVKKTARVTDKKTGNKVTEEKKVVKHQKKYPGYLFAEVEFNDRILYLFRETSGVGDFVGGAGPLKPPPPMSDREVQAMLTGVVDKSAPGAKRKGPAKVKLDIEKGDKVKIRDGAFANMEGEVKEIQDAKDETETPKVKVTVTIFGRPVEVDLDYWHVDKV